MIDECPGEFLPVADHTANPSFTAATNRLDTALMKVTDRHAVLADTARPDWFCSRHTYIYTAGSSISQNSPTNS